MSHTYDGLNRVTSAVTSHKDEPVLTTNYTFADTETTAGAQVTAIGHITTGETTPYNTTYSYTYDDNGNILTVSDGTNTTSYVYDSANQLIRENNEAGAYTYTWEYDNAGNILNRKEYCYNTDSLGDLIDTVTYTYGDDQWGDLLTVYDGKTIEYDPIGNPEKYGDWQMQWQHGRQLASMTDGTTTWNYTYNGSGMRTKRTDGETTYEYVYAGSDLVYMSIDGEPLRFSYSESGAPMSVIYKDSIYFYVTNLQGDVVALVSSLGNTVVEYTYDAWGNIISTTGRMADGLGKANPLRYRGYVYDSETKLYYVSSRYYDSKIGRWINADTLVSTGQGIIGNNMFVYCLNNPVLYLDRSGRSASLPPMIENGLNLPASGGIPVVIDGTTYYYAIDIQNGQLYEYWFDADGNLIWGRHHSDHNKPWKHDDPHDHKGGKDKNGNNTLVDGPQPVDERFRGPDQFARHRKTDLNAGYVVAGAVVGVVVYQVAKWTIATLLAAATGGSSYAFAALAP